MKIWIKIVENTRDDDHGIWMQVEYKLVPYADGINIGGKLAEPIRPGFHIVDVDECAPAEKRAGGEGN